VSTCEWSENLRRVLADIGCELLYSLPARLKKYNEQQRMRPKEIKYNSNNKSKSEALLRWEEDS
jgi:hypothetical protein